jgi:multidrug efflux pump subunit AcrB
MTNNKVALPLEIGAMYEAIDLANVTIKFIVQKKPSLIVNQVSNKVAEAKRLPDHLKGADWYSIQNCTTKKCLWLHAPSYKITQKIKE